MVRDRDSFGLALSQLREDLRDGRIRPGEPLATADLAATLKISATPIREALSRLAGEGLVDDRRGRGVYALGYGAAEVEEFYQLHGAYIVLALDSRRDSARIDGVSAVAEGRAQESARTLRARSERFWSALVHVTDGGALVRAHQRVSDQLAVLRLVEPLLWTDASSEMDQLTVLAAKPALDDFRTAVHKYHERRQVSARALAALLRDQIQSGPI